MQIDVVPQKFHTNARCAKLVVDAISGKELFHSKEAYAKINMIGLCLPVMAPYSLYLSFVKDSKLKSASNT